MICIELDKTPGKVLCYAPQEEAEVRRMLRRMARHFVNAEAFDATSVRCTVLGWSWNGMANWMGTGLKV